MPKIITPANFVIIGIIVLVWYLGYMHFIAKHVESDEKKGNK